MIKNKILFIGKFFYPPLGGGEFYIKNILSHLMKNGYSCHAACFYDAFTVRPFVHTDLKKWDDVEYTQMSLLDDKCIRQLYDRIDPEIIITQSDFSETFVKIAKEKNIKVVFGVHFYNEIVGTKNNDPYLYMLEKDLSTVDLRKDKHFLFTMSDRVFVNSDFMSKIVQKYVGIIPDCVIYPPIDESKIIKDVNFRSKDKKYVLFINPTYGKGMELLRQLVRSMPETDFMVVGKLIDKTVQNINCYQELRLSKNVVIKDHVDNMSDIYKEAKVLIVPSIVDETFSMVTLEAFLNGVPAIVSPHGNLPYLVDNEDFCVDVDNVSQWADIIRRLYSDESYYLDICDRYYKLAYEKYDPKRQYEKFLKMIRELQDGA